MEVFYNIHNFIKVKIEGGKLNLADGYNHYLRYFQVVKQFAENNYEVKEFSNFKLPKNYSKADGAFKFENGICFFKEKYALVFNGKKIIEYTNYANRATNLWLQLLLLKQGLTFVHGAGIELNGKGIIFPAFGGVGKTILIAGLRKLNSFKFFGDDYVIVDKKGNMFSYPSDFSVYDYHLDFFTELKNTSFNYYLRRRKLFGGYYETKRTINFIAKRLELSSVPVLKGWHANYIKVPTANLIKPQKIGEKTKLFASVFLERYNGEKIRSMEISLGEIIRVVSGILNLEFKDAFSYLYVLAAVGYFDMADFQTQQKEILQKTFSNIKLYRIYIPQNIKIEEYLNYMDKFVNNLTQ